VIITDEGSIWEISPDGCLCNELVNITEHYAGDAGYTWPIFKLKIQLEYSS